MRLFRVLSVVGLILTFCSSLFAQAAQPSVVQIDSAFLNKLQRGERVPTLIVLKQQVDTTFAQALPTKAAKNQAVVVALRSQMQRDQAPLLAMLATRGIKGESFLSLNAVAADVDLATVQALSLRSDVRHIIDDTPRLRQAPPEPALDSQRPAAPDATEWGLDNINAPQVWALGFRGQGIVVAGEDTGIRWTHNALKHRYRGWNGVAASHDYNWYDGIRTSTHNSTCGSATTKPCDDNSHGTHTMGTMVGSDGANQVGVAPDAQWIGCRNMDAGFGTIASYVRCIDWMLAPYPLNGTTAQGDPSKAPDVINNSWGCATPAGGEDCDAAHLGDIQPSVQNVTNAGIMFVASAGNDGPACNTIQTPPALYPESFVVGAYNSSNTIASFSSRGPILYNGTTRIGPDLSAPGVSVRSATNSSDASYEPFSGTSMAAPHVAGAVALLWSARPELRGQIQLTRRILTETATPTTTNQTCGVTLGSSIPNNTYGAGRVNILAAIQPTLQGNVTLNGLPVNATLTLESPAMQWQTSGAYSTTLPSGTYTLTAKIAGFPAQSKVFTIVEDRITTLDFVFANQVTIQNFAFNPNTVTIFVGNSVTWTNKDNATHTSTSSEIPPLWDSGNLDTNDSFTHTFTETGTFKYLCDIHEFMTGTVNVVSEQNQPIFLPLIVK